ncbi:MAG: exosortase [Candidatus Acidiferrum sp.]
MSHPLSMETKRWLLYFSWVFLCFLLFWKPLLSLFDLTTYDETTSHILIIPFISGWLLFTDRKSLRVDGSQGKVLASAFLACAVLAIYFSMACRSCGSKLQLAGYVFSLILLLTAGFLAILGREPARSSWFALAFLLFAIPVPDAVLNRIIYALQAGSAAVAEFFFDLSGVPVLREGFIFRLPRMSIEVAKECSGIRSSIALLILALLVAHFSFRPLWKKLVFVIAGLLMMIVKNGIRITTLTLLANYVDPDFLYGKLHHEGGIVFFLIGLALLIPVFWLLQKGEPAPKGGREIKSIP